MSKTTELIVSVPVDALAGLDCGHTEYAMDASDACVMLLPDRASIRAKSANVDPAQYSLTVMSGAARILLHQTSAANNPSTSGLDETTSVSPWTAIISNAPP